MRQFHPLCYCDAIGTFAGGRSTVHTGKSTFSLAQFQVGPASLFKISMALAIHKCPVNGSDVDAVTTGFKALTTHNTIFMLYGIMIGIKSLSVVPPHLFPYYPHIFHNLLYIPHPRHSTVHKILIQYPLQGCLMGA